MSTTKAIEIKLELTGHGVVQTGGDEKSLSYQRSDIDVQRYNNVVYAKGNLVRDPQHEGKYIKILKISGDGLRHAIHAKAMPSNTPNVLISKASRIFYTATLDALLRGWLSVSSDDRKKSAYALTAAEDKNAVLQIELFSNSAPKESASDVNAASDTSLFARETTGDTHYTATGFINIEELRFISVSDIYGRRAVQNDDAEAFRKFLTANIGSEVDVPRYWRRNDGSSNIPEFGILLNDAQVAVLVKHLLLEMAEISISKSASGFAKTSKVEIKVISRPTEDYAKSFSAYFDEAGIHADVVPSEYAVAWTEISKADALAEIAAVEAEIKAYKMKRAEENAAKKAEKKEKKGKKELVPKVTAADAEGA